jgi:nucleotide-binding universal stress UspA family protein
MARHLLIPTDFSEPSEHATKTGIDLALALDAKITLVHIQDTPRFGFAEVPSLLGATEDALNELAQADMLRLIERVHARDIDVDFVIRKGHPAASILDVAGEVDADLIVLGTHGRRALDRVLMGSVAERLVRTSPVPVLVVPPAVATPHS